jgi:OmpA-OmpF porin, OOP family
MIAFICCSAMSGLVLKVSIRPSELAPTLNVGARRQLGYHLHVRKGLALGCVCWSGVASSEPASEPRFEASGFVGIDYFGDNIQLGNSWAPEQIPGTSPVIGARLGYVALPSLWTRDALTLQLATELELAFAPAFTGGDFGGGRQSYFAPVFGWRGQARLRMRGWAAEPQLVVGVGGETVASSSPFMQKETDPVAYWGPGVAIPVSETWQIVVELRHGIMPAREGTATSTFEAQLGLSARFGLPTKRIRPPVEQAPVALANPDKDTDGDGIPDYLDKCPLEPETVNGVDDDDGCPEEDPDGDGIIGAADKCPNDPEDFDHFQDADGCPDPDNDSDGIDDAHDACPNDPETKNGFEDADGCPDEVPASLLKALAAAVRFEPGRARLLDPAKRALAPLADQMRSRLTIRVVVTGHPATAKDDDLAKRRAEAVKWYLVDQGIAADRLDTVVGAPSTKGPAVEFALAVK